MKKVLITIGAFILLLCSCVSEAPINDESLVEGASNLSEISSEAQNADSSDASPLKPTEIWYSSGELTHYEFRKSPDGYLVETAKHFHDEAWEKLSLISISVKKDGKLLYSRVETFDENGERNGSAYSSYDDGNEIERVSISHNGKNLQSRFFRNGKLCEEYITRDGELIYLSLVSGDTQTTTYYIDGKVNHIEKRYPTENPENDGYDSSTYATYDGEMNLLSLNYGRKTEYKLDDGRKVTLHLDDPSDKQYVELYVDDKQIATFYRDTAAKIINFKEIADGYSEAYVEKTYEEYRKKVEAEGEITSKWYELYIDGN